MQCINSILVSRKMPMKTKKLSWNPSVALTLGPAVLFALASLLVWLPQYLDAQGVPVLGLTVVAVALLGWGLQLMTSGRKRAK